MEAYELREVLELTAIAKSRGHLDREAAKHLHAIVARMRTVQAEPAGAEREKKAVALDYEFHAAICALACNDFLNSFFRQLSVHVNMTLIHEKTYHQLEAHWPDVHAEILDCLENDPDRAEEVLRRHFTNVTDILEAGGDESKGTEGKRTDP